MTDQKRTALKSLVKLKTLATLADINQRYLSDIINNNKQPSRFLAERLAHHANALVAQTDFFTTEDFLN